LTGAGKPDSILCGRSIRGSTMSWQIFMHSVRQVFGNLEGALRVSAVLTILQGIVLLTLGRSITDPAAAQAEMMQGEFNLPGYLLLLVLIILTSVWIAVGWHRYVLTNERPDLLPKLHLDRVLGYFGKSLLIGLLLLPVALVVAAVAGFILFPVFGNELGTPSLLFGMLFGLIVYIPIGLVAMRLSAALPGVALQGGVSVFAGWRATEGQTGTILGVVVYSVIGGLLLNLPAIALFAPGSAIAQIWQFVAQWIIVMVGASILTTLYGHYVEGRPLV
jgi:hypothetical protein